MNYHKTKGFEGLLGFPELTRSQGLMKLSGRNLKPSGKKSEIVVFAQSQVFVVFVIL